MNLIVAFFARQISSVGLDIYNNNHYKLCVKNCCILLQCLSELKLLDITLAVVFGSNADQSNPDLWAWKHTGMSTSCSDVSHMCSSTLL